MRGVTKAAMQTRKLGPFEVSAIGLGCMGLSHAYGNPPDPKTAGEVLLKALDLGYTISTRRRFTASAPMRRCSGTVLKHRRKDYVLASKCGMFRTRPGGGKSMGVRKC